MSEGINRYLIKFRARLHANCSVKEDAACELCAHLQDRIQDLRGKGLSEEEAEDLAIRVLGPPEPIARGIYEAHSQGSRQEAFLAALPHLMVALLFASFYWQNAIFPSISLVVVIGVMIYGWHQNRPVWLMPWLGYYLLPVTASGILLIYLSRGWGWIVTLVYIPVALYVTIYITTQVARQDKLYASLMLAPLPMVFSWLLLLGTGEQFARGNIVMAQLEAKVPWIVISFLVLAVATALFIRLRQYQQKTAILLVPPIAIPISVAWAGGWHFNFWSWFLLALALLVFVSPLCIRTGESLPRHKEQTEWLVSPKTIQDEP